MEWTILVGMVAGAPSLRDVHKEVVNFFDKNLFIKGSDIPLVCLIQRFVFRICAKNLRMKVRW